MEQGCSVTILRPEFLASSGRLIHQLDESADKEYLPLDEFDQIFEDIRGAVEEAADDIGIPIDISFPQIHDFGYEKPAEYKEERRLSKGDIHIAVNPGVREWGYLTPCSKTKPKHRSLVYFTDKAALQKSVKILNAAKIPLIGRREAVRRVFACRLPLNEEQRAMQMDAIVQAARKALIWPNKIAS